MGEGFEYIVRVLKITKRLRQMGSCRKPEPVTIMANVLDKIFTSGVFDRIIFGSKWKISGPSGTTTPSRVTG